MVFLRCNPRHHSIAFQPRMPDLPRSRDKRMWHFMLEVNSIDDVGAALDWRARRESRGLDPRRHSNDQMVSIRCVHLHVDTSGFEVEYGWGAVSSTTPRGRCSVPIAAPSGAKGQLDAAREPAPAAR